MSKAEQKYLIVMFVVLFFADIALFPEPDATGLAAKYAHADLPMIYFFTHFFVRGIWILFFSRRKKD